MKDLASEAFVGLIFGFTLSMIGFSSWDQVHAMFTFADLRLVLAFAVAVAVLAMVWWVGRDRLKHRGVDRPIHNGTLIGGALFGVGWALSGACPSIVWAQLGEGQLGAFATLGGVLFGNWVYAIVHERWFRWDIGGCATD